MPSSVPRVSARAAPSQRRRVVDCSKSIFLFARRNRSGVGGKNCLTSVQVRDPEILLCLKSLLLALDFYGLTQIFASAAVCYSYETPQRDAGGRTPLNGAENDSGAFPCGSRPGPPAARGAETRSTGRTARPHGARRVYGARRQFDASIRAPTRRGPAATPRSAGGLSGRSKLRCPAFPRGLRAARPCVPSARRRARSRRRAGRPVAGRSACAARSRDFRGRACRSPRR